MLLSYYDKNLIEAGCDEAGRGCLAGPVFAAAVILPKDYKHKLLNDSKQLSEQKRNLLRKDIEKDAVAYSVQQLEPVEIDQINILNASIEGMHRSVFDLKIQPGLLLIDGNRFHPYKNIQHICIIKGDGKYLSIAAASILAKTYRDDHMIDLHDQFPHYNWKQNKGYPTLEHREAINRHGITQYHRKSFNLNFQKTLFY